LGDSSAVGISDSLARAAATVLTMLTKPQNLPQEGVWRDDAALD
jgi:hypothetical protein